MAALWRSHLILLLVIYMFKDAQGGEGGEPEEEGGDPVNLPAHAQKSYPLNGLICYPDGVRLPCDCDDDNGCYIPCCRDWSTGETFMPTFYKWSHWIPCTICNDYCDETKECRIKYDEVAQLVRPNTVGEGPEPSRRRKKREVTEVDESGLPTFEDSWMAHHHRCKVQRSECRIRQSGEWGDWEEVGECSSECHKGVLSEHRLCLDLEGNPIDPDKCPGGEEASHRFTPCNTELCSDVSEWEDDGECYLSGSECLLNQTRSCLSTEDGDPPLTEECAEQVIECPTDVCDLTGISDLKWGEWSSCNSSCTSGWRYREATCVYVIDDSPSTECDPLTDIEWEECDTHICHQYHEFTASEDCSQTCGEGTQTFTRTCILQGKVIPVGCDEETRACNDGSCPNFEYEYAEFGPCNETCTKGVKVAVGTCKNSITNEVSDQCVDGQTTTKTEACNLDLCDEYGPWTGSTACSETCGDGIQDQTRTCVTVGTDPTPALPAECISRSGASCNLGQCLTVGNWSEYSTCSETCTPGIQTRTRDCLDQDTLEPASGCTEALSEEQDCNTHLCSTYNPSEADSECLLWPERCQEPSVLLRQTCASNDGDAPDECALEYQDCTYTGPVKNADIVIIMDNTMFMTDACVPDTPIAADDTQLTDPAVSPHFIQQKKFINDFACAWPYITGSQTNIAVQKHATPVCADLDNNLAVTFANGVSATAVHEAMNVTGTQCSSAVNHVGALLCAKNVKNTGRADVKDVFLVIVSEVTPTVEASLVSAVSNSMPSIIRPQIGTDTLLVVVSVAPRADNDPDINAFACLDSFTQAGCPNYVGSIYDSIDVIVKNIQDLILV